MIRVVAGGEQLAAFPDTPHTDRYVKILFQRPGVEYPEPFDLDQVRAELPREQWPMTRTYTVRALDHAAGELTIDFVHHGDSGIAGPWAAAARPGDVLRLAGPGGAYA
ncbi:MAG: siderophore-interacting protein, partial [Pseudonocardia sp.]